MLDLTDSAKEKLNELCAENNCYAISLNLKGGGCAGFQYEWGLLEYESDLEDGDELFETGNGDGKLVVNVDSLVYLFGAEVNYVKDIMGSQFEINNPNAKSSCGCGVSVNF